MKLLPYENAYRWYVIHTNPKQEERADSNLRAWSVETMFPKFKEIFLSQQTKLVSYTTKPLFPGYIFARFKVTDIYHKIRYTRGVKNVVCCGQIPLPVDDEIVTMIKGRMDQDGFVRIGGDFKPGDEVQIHSGPLKNLTGVFERKMSESDRVLILLDTISYQAHVLVAHNMIRKIQ